LTVGDVAVHSESGLAWIVSGANAENRIEARGATQVEAWRNAVLQAEAVGNLAGNRTGRLCPGSRRAWLTPPRACRPGIRLGLSDAADYVTDGQASGNFLKKDCQRHDCL
jgi:hypothetical protein